MRILIPVLLLFTVSLTACGGGSDAPAAPGTPPPAPEGGGGGAAVSDPVAITVVAAATTAGVNIAVPTKAGGEPNAEMLGVTPIGEGGSAQNTGASVRRGDTVRVILFGASITGDMQVLIGGPPDIQVSNIQSIKSTTGTTGISFHAAVANTAAVGSRTVFLRKGENVTAFSGGLEVLP